MKKNGQTLETEEPKFSTNKWTYFLRPDNTTMYNNLYFATAYTKTETDTFEMESAAESGRRAARLIENSVNVIPENRPKLFAPFRWLDSIFKPINLYQYATLGWFFLGLPIATVFLIGRIIAKKLLLKLK